MSKRFRWKKGQLDKLDKDIKKANRVIDKLSKMGYENLPEKMNYYTERNKIIANNENAGEHLKDTFKILSLITDKNNQKIIKSDKGLQVPLMTKKVIDVKVKSINKERKKDAEFYKQFETTDRGKEIHQANKKDVQTEFRPKKFNIDKMSKKDFEMYKQTLGEYDRTKSIKDEIYRENFYKALRKQMTDEEYKEMIKIMDKIPTEEIVKKYYTDENMNIDFVYEPADREMLMSTIIESWNELAKEGGYI